MNSFLGPRFPALTAVLVDALAAVTTITVVVGAPVAIRSVCVLSFVLVGPGAAMAALLGIREVASWASVTLGGSIAAGVLISGAAAIAGWWHPTVLIALLAVFSTAGATAAWWRSRPLTHLHEEARPCTSS
ncbi:hypothetical protein [Sporichthya polymorpha]|uniref:hypothetical protein n=1 Tax=Sporichthya polymorpha TaxID=35751 RepID=UPI00037321A0|nr:hypothetical protein [Sporichthya polymorpha]